MVEQIIKINIISIHAPLRERLIPVLKIIRIKGISIHAPLRERLLTSTSLAKSALFQSTLPHGSDANSSAGRGCGHISIHAPSREQLQFQRSTQERNHFNPRSLAGATCWKNSN